MFTKTFYDLLKKNLAQRGDHIATVDGNEELSYAELSQRVDALAGLLWQQGVRRRDRVIVHLRKSNREVVAMFAVAKLGAICVNVNFQWTVEQLNYVSLDSGARVLVMDARRAQELAQLGLSDRIGAVIVNGKCPEHPRMLGWDDAPDLDLGPAPCIDADLAGIIYTSGSTGQPKGVMLTHLNIIQGARSVAEYLHLNPDDRLISVLPYSFDYGLNQLTTMCLVGGTIVQQAVVMPTEVVKTLVEHKITGMAAVPPLWSQLVRLLVESPADLPDLRYVTNSGGKIPKNILRVMPSALGQAKIYLMYGLTEAFRSTFLPPELFESKLGSIGRAIPNVETFVIKHGEGICGPGEQGELVHRGTLVSKGYWGMPEATAEKIRPCPELAELIGDEPVVYSGDIVQVDEDGYYWFVGRADTLIKSSGFRLSPDEVEDLVARSGIIADAVAFGVEDQLYGQIVHVAVSRLERGEFDMKALKSYCQRTMPHYMVPKEIHLWEGAMPRTSSGKLDKPEIIRRCREGLITAIEP